MINRIFAPAFAALFAALVIYGFVPPPQRAAAFPDQGTFAGTSTGSANAQAIVIANIASATGNLTGVPLRFIPGFTNTGPATISVSGLAPVAILRPSSIGLVALSGQELLIGEPTSVMFNGTNYVLTSNVDMTPIGKAVEFRGSATPRGTLIEDGSCVSRTTYAPLFTVVGTTYSACDGSTTFGVPDSRGTAFFALDGQGANGLAGRITTASCATPNAVGLCGNEQATLTAAKIPTITAAGSGSGSVSVQSQTPGVGVITGEVTSGADGGGAGNQVLVNASSTQITSVGSASVSVSTTSNNTGGSSVSHPVLNPSSFGRRAIKY